MLVATQIQRPQMHPGEVEAPGTIPALARLLEALSVSGVRWCSWKSNAHLAKALAGETDLDVLVHPEDIGAFRIVLAEHRLRSLAPAPTREHPGMEHHLGMDPDSGRLFHLHVHTELVLGEQHVKNHRLPMEEAMLVSAAPDVRGAGPAARRWSWRCWWCGRCSKYRARDVVKDVLKIRSPGLKDETRAELDWLLARTSVSEVRAMVIAADEPLPARIVVGFLEAYRARSSVGARVPAAPLDRLRRALASRRRVGRGPGAARALRIGTDRAAARRADDAGGGRAHRGVRGLGRLGEVHGGRRDGGVAGLEGRDAGDLPGEQEPVAALALVVHGVPGAPAHRAGGGAAVRRGVASGALARRDARRHARGARARRSRGTGRGAAPRVARPRPGARSCSSTGSRCTR